MSQTAPDNIARMTVKQTADLLGVSIDTLRRWDRDGRLRSSGRSPGGWRYYLFTDMKKILDDLTFDYQKKQMHKKATDMAMDTLHTFSAAYHIPLRTHAESLNDASTAQQEASLTDKAQKLLNAVNTEDYKTVIQLLSDIHSDLKKT